MESTKYRCAIIGVGRMGFYGFSTPFIYDHFSAYRADPRCEVVALCDTDPAKDPKIGMPFYADAAKMLEEQKPDIVSICTPPSEHTNGILECAGKVKAIWCEKPIASSPLSVVTFPPFPIQVNYIRRFDQLHRDIRDEIQSWNFGDLQWIRILYSGGMMNSGSHFVDLIRWWYPDIQPWDKVQFVETDAWDGKATEMELQFTKCRIRLLEGGLTCQIEGPARSTWYGNRGDILTWQKYERAAKEDIRTMKESWPPKVFMENALSNIINHLERGAPLTSSVVEAVLTLQEALEISRERNLKW